MPACFGPEFDQKGQPSVACICMWRLCHAGKMSGKLEIHQVFHECCGLQPSTGPPCICSHPWKLEFNPSISLSVFEDAGMFWTWIWPKGSTFSGVYLHVKIVPCRENEWQTYIHFYTHFGACEMVNEPKILRSNNSVFRVIVVWCFFLIFRIFKKSWCLGFTLSVLGIWIHTYRCSSNVTGFPLRPTISPTLNAAGSHWQ